jgi:multicomponent Na+:H+ antiporter subunit F
VIASDSAFLTYFAFFLALALLMPFYRIIAGPSIFDRMLGVGVISSKTLVLLAVVGLLYERLAMFVDIVIAYSLLNFIGTLAIAKYLQQRGGKQ